MDMIERVARALWDSPDYIGLCSDERRRDGSWHDCIHLARAAIAAMREPTEKMIDAGSKEQRNILSKPIEGIWTAMIDAALTEAKPTTKGE